MNKCLSEVNLDLNNLLNGINVNLVKQFVADYKQLDLIEIYLFTAMKSDPNEIFYQSEDSEDWKKLKQFITVVDIQDKI
jgi:hypothetical protein